MAAVLVNKDNINFFKDMLNEEIMASLEDKNTLALGNVTDGFTDGIIAGEFLQSACFRISWIYVAKSQRGKGIGTNLLTALKKALEAAHTEKVYFQALRNVGNDNTINFLLSKGFTANTIAESIAEFKLSDMSEYLKYISPKGNEYTLLKDIPMHQVLEYLANEKEEDFAAYLYKSEKGKNFLEESCLIVEDDIITKSVLAIRNDEDNIIDIVRLKGDTMEEKKQMLKFFFGNLMLKYGRDAMVRFLCDDYIAEDAIKYVGNQRETTEMMLGQMFL